ncbi:TIGR03752 family integrating conjugative element protein [Comamonas jiangduensis]|uniref:TIGR03752 family integrating conjugative element protein n=1 Tax=Comamonas jiangduensis TaxID=1194168 RepID=UPI003BF83EE4
MAIARSNKLISLLAIFAAIFVVYILYKQVTSTGKVPAGEPLTSIPTPEKLPGVAGADNDNVSETLRTVTTSNEELRKQVKEVVDANKRLMEENKRLTAGNKPATGPVPHVPNASPDNATVSASSANGGDKDILDKAIDRGSNAIDTFSQAFELHGPKPRTETEAANAAANRNVPQPGPTVPLGQTAPGSANAGGYEVEGSTGGYRVVTPMGYSVVQEGAKGAGGKAGTGPQITRYVRTSGNDAYANSSVGGSGPAATAAKAAARAPEKPKTIPYFTVPENSTLVGARTMTSLIGRVPIDGRVTDPMQFKAIVGRDNLAANGWELPPDLEGMIFTGIAIGDMALSCTEGRVRSVTFVFNDGTVRTVSARTRGSTGGGSSGGFGNSANDIGFISDAHGNPCIAGKFVTNAPAYLADMAMLKGLDVAAEAFADAQRTVSNNMMGGQTSTITGSTGNYALGKAASGATDEIVKWMTQRLKNSFDAVIVPSGKEIVFHLDRELQIDKEPNARKVIYRNQGGRQLARGEHYGLE